MKPHFATMDRVGKSFELPSFYRIILGPQERQEAFLALRFLWFSLFLAWFYVETITVVSLFPPETINLGWQLLCGWGLVSLLGDISYNTLMHAQKPQAMQVMWLVLISIDAAFIGLFVGATGVSFSLGLFPAILYVLLLIFLGSPKHIAFGHVVLVMATLLGIQLSVVGDRMHTAHWQWAAAGALILAGIAGFVSMNLRRYGVQVIEDRLYQKWLERMNAIIFDLMPAGAVVCDESGLMRHMNRFIKPYVNLLLEPGATVFQLHEPWKHLNTLQELMLSKDLEFQLSHAEDPEGRLFQAEIRALTAEGHEARQLYLIMFYDITETRRRQEEAELRRKWASFQSISTGLVHEIRNPLSAISGVIENVLESPNMPDAERKRLIEMVQFESDRLNRLIQDFLDSLGSTLTLQTQEEDILALCEQFYKLVSQDQKVLKNQVHLAFQNRLKKRVKVKCDRDRLLQVFHNLFQNALYAVLSSGRTQHGISIEIEADPKAKDAVLIRFTDYGTGISQEVLAQVFDPFFTTKQQGIGLGLSIVYRIIDAHGGTIRIHSVPDKYSKVEIHLPVE